MTREHRPGARGPRPQGRPGPHPQDELVGRLHGEIERLNRQDEELRHVIHELRKSQEQMMQHMEKQTHEMHQMMEKMRETLHAQEPHDHEHN
jgi:predicted RNase H-like nuclease (RuvC/YqgF family)